MNTETRAALEGSIKKWQGIVEGTVLNEGPADCPLCKMFLNVLRCDGCPVKIETRQDGCHGSPYHDFENYGSKFPGYQEIDREEWEAESKRLAQAELDFLISLRED